MRECWQIRQEQFNHLSGNQGKWVLDCADCAARASGQSCWTAGAGRQICCAPVYVSCDFCVLYIAHRLEIPKPESAVQGDVGGADDGELNSQRRQASNMERAQFNVPDMFADHHVLKVRAALAELSGVEGVVASSAFRVVAMQYDPARLSPDDIAAALARAGYPAAAEPVTNPVPGTGRRGDPAWDRMGIRISRTDARDARPGR